MTLMCINYINYVNYVFSIIMFICILYIPNSSLSLIYYLQFVLMNYWIIESTIIGDIVVDFSFINPLNPIDGGIIIIIKWIIIMWTKGIVWTILITIIINIRPIGWIWMCYLMRIITIIIIWIIIYSLIIITIIIIFIFFFWFFSSFYFFFSWFSFFFLFWQQYYEKHLYFQNHYQLQFLGFQSKFV